MDADEVHSSPEPLPPLNSPFKWSLLDIALISGGSVFVMVVGVLGLSLSMPLFGAEQPTLVLSLGLAALEGIAFLGSIYLLGLRRHDLSWNALGLKNLPHRWRMISILVGLLAIPGSGLIATMVQIGLKLPQQNPQLQFLAPEGFSWSGGVGMLLLGGVIAPFAEEAFFRGVFYRWLRDRWGIPTGIIISSIIFGALHGDVSISIAAAILGAILAFVYERSGSLWSPFIIHFINNSFKILLLYIFLYLGIPISGI
jgi:uncharacterized protein